MINYKSNLHDYINFRIFYDYDAFSLLIKINIILYSNLLNSRDIKI